MTPTSPLQGRTVVLTRTPDHNAETRHIFEAHGASVLCFPTIMIQDPPSWGEVDNALWKLADYTDVCFTSQYAVKKLVERARLVRPKALETLSTRTLFAVGEKTRATLESLGFHGARIPLHASGAELVAAVRTQSLEGKKFLYPKGSIARDDVPAQLRTLGVPVDEIVVYATTIPQHTDVETVLQKFTQKEIDIVTFFSPSAVYNCVEMIGTEPLASVVVGVIGNTTAEAVKKVGLEPTIIASHATAEGLCQALETHFQKQQ